LAGVLTVLCCGVPGTTFWTVAVSHGPEGADCPACAVTGFLNSGPLGYGLVADRLEFDHVLCAERRPQLRRQAEQIRNDMDGTMAGADAGYYNAETENLITTQRDEGDRATLAPHVYLVYMTRDENNQPGQWYIDAGVWTFHVVHRDGWQVCQLDTPNICTQVVICDPAQRITPSSSPSPSGPGFFSPVPCSTADPFRAYHHCPSESPTPTPTAPTNGRDRQPSPTSTPTPQVPG